MFISKYNKYMFISKYNFNRVYITYTKILTNTYQTFLDKSTQYPV